MARRRRPDDPLPRYEQMIGPTLQAIVRIGGSGTVQEIDDTVIDIMQFTEGQIAIPHGQGPRSEIAYRLAWARNALARVGAIENSRRGVWTLTEHGRSLKPSQAPFAWQNIVPDDRKTESDNTETTGAFDQILDAPTRFRSTVFEEWRDNLLTILQQMPPPAFERLCQRVLRESGFTRVDVVGRSGDGGIDGIGVLRISLLSFQVFFQCKRYKGSVGASAIRDFRGAMVGRTDKGLFITTGYFTPDAKREAARDGAPVLDLIDGDQLCRILKELSLGITTETVEEVEIDPDWFSAI
jgi:restriction system protein